METWWLRLDALSRNQRIGNHVCVIFKVGAVPDIEE
jgi:hypothetical protein